MAKLPTVRVLIALATTYDRPLHQLDAHNAFLHGHLDEKVYILPPKGCVVPSWKYIDLRCPYMG